MASTIWIYSFNSFEAVRVMENCNAPTVIFTTVFFNFFFIVVVYNSVSVGIKCNNNNATHVTNITQIMDSINYCKFGMPNVDKTIKNFQIGDILF